MQRTLSQLKPWLWVLALVCVVMSTPETASAWDVNPQQMQSGSLLLRMNNGYSSAMLLDTDVDIQISGLVARVTLRQEFENSSHDWVEGIYVFPLPDKAAVDRMRLHIGDRFIEGEIQEKQQAKKTYERARQAGKKASLVEQQRANLFTSAVANIAPGERVVVEIEYLEDIRYSDGQFSIRFPMTLTPRYIPGGALPDRTGSGWSADTDRVADGSEISPPQVSSSKAHQLSLTAHLNAGVQLDTIDSRYHPIIVTQQSGQYTVTLRSGTVAMDHDFELQWRPAPSAVPRAMSFVETVDGTPYYLLTMLPPDQASLPMATMPRETIFIIDTSGSMHGVSMQQARRAVQLALKGMKATDRFNVIEFNSVTNALYKESQAATAESVSQALHFVQQLQANGGTEMQPALSLALDSLPAQGYLRQIVFITDGSVGYEDELFSMIEDRLGAARLFTVGIGSAPNSWFMRKAAEAGRGSYTYISALHEVQQKMDGLFKKLEQPQVTDIDVQWPASAVVQTYPATVPDLYLGEPVTVLASISGELRAQDHVRVSGNSLSGAWSVDLPVATVTDSTGVAALWARARIGDLIDRERRDGTSDELRASIAETALRHHLVSKYTSLVAIDKTPSRPGNSPLFGEQVPNLMPYGQSTNAIFAFPATATNAPALRLSGFVSLLASLSLFILLRRAARVRCVSGI